MQSVAIQRSIGSAKLYKSIVNCVVLPQPVKVHVVLAKDIATLKQLVAHVGLHGVAATVFICAESDKLLALHIQMRCHIEIQFDGIYFDYIQFNSTHCMI